jgi:Cu(I)/Ag(I) efflux system membrane fusion protein
MNLLLRNLKFVSPLLILLVACAAGPQEKKPLYYANPMDPSIHSDVPSKDSMGMDYVPVYAEPPAPALAPGVLYYASPMDPSVHSDVPTKDEMGMDYVPVYAQGTKDLVLTSAQEARIGVAVTPVTRQTLTATVETVGKISLNEKKTTVVSARFAGRIEKLYVNFTGFPVGAGQPMLSIYSPSLMTAQQELIQSAPLGTPPGSPMETNLFRSARDRLRLWGFSANQINAVVTAGVPEPSLTLLSPLSGTVVKLGVSNGMYVEEGQVLFELSDLSRVWVEAEVFEKDLAFLTADSRIRVTPLAYPDQAFEDKISFVNPVLDPNTRTVKIRSEVPNPQGLLLPGMFVSVRVSTPLPEAVLAVPEAAVLDTGTRKIVYVQVSTGRYAARDVVLKAQVGAVFPVVSGLAEGELVVTAANFLIDSESRLKGLVE